MDWILAYLDFGGFAQYTLLGKGAYIVLSMLVLGVAIKKNLRGKQGDEAGQTGTVPAKQGQVTARERM